MPLLGISFNRFKLIQLGEEEVNILQTTFVISI